MILLDTDICIEILRKSEKVINKRAQCDDVPAISFMSIAELYNGAEKSADPSGNYSLIEEFLLSIEIIHTDIQIMQRFCVL